MSTTSLAAPRPGAARHVWPFDEFIDIAMEYGLSGPPVLDGPSGPTIRMDGRELTNFAGINFLHTEGYPEVRRHFAWAAQEYGLATGGSRVSQGVMRPHQELEDDLCRATGKERAISFASGLLANMGFVHAMTHHTRMEAGIEVDLKDVALVIDRDCHWSFWKAAEHLEYGRRLFAFRHNDPADLERILRGIPDRRVVVAFESLYSVDGTVAPMKELLDVCEKYGALSYVDDANGFGVYGPGHRPFAAEWAEMSRATFVMVSYSKALGLEGGAIAGPWKPILAFEVLSGTSMFTAAMQPPTASTARMITRMLDERPEIVDGYLDRVTRFRERLAETGCRLNETPSYITSVHIGSDETAYLLREAFVERGFQIPVFSYPATRRNRAVLRLFLNAGHTDAQIDDFLTTLVDLKREHAF